MLVRKKDILFVNKKELYNMVVVPKKKNDAMILRLIIIVIKNIQYAISVFSLCLSVCQIFFRNISSLTPS